MMNHDIDVGVSIFQSAQVVIALRPFSTSATPPGNSCWARNHTFSLRMEALWLKLQKLVITDSDVFLNMWSLRP